MNTSELVPVKHGAGLLYHCEDLGYSILARPQGHYVDYTVYEHAGRESVAGSLIFYSEEDENEFVDNVENAQVYISGSVKWDGCSNWDFIELSERKTMIHGCSREDLSNIGEVLAACWDLTALHCPQFADYNRDSLVQSQAVGSQVLVPAEKCIVCLSNHGGYREVQCIVCDATGWEMKLEHKAGCPVGPALLATSETPNVH